MPHLRQFEDTSAALASRFMSIGSGLEVTVNQSMPIWHEAILVLDQYRSVMDADDVPLFRREDLPEWIVFTIVTTGLIVFDNVILHGKHKNISFNRACCYTLFWICCAVAFNMYVYARKGPDAAFTWATGYFLEWMLSVDNLFVFHLVFQIYKTPDHLKHKPLFWGIVGAIFFRMLFFIVEEWLVHSFWWMHVVFGIFLIYTGIKTMLVEDIEADPSTNIATVWLANHLPLINKYDMEGRFIVRVDVVDMATENIPAVDMDASRHLRGVDMGSKRYRGTLLLLVVICLEISDIIFAIDSVSAIVAQIPDLFLAYTACVFAMLGLRATFFVIDRLIRIFVLLKYGVGFILVFIGFKLLGGKEYQMPAWVVFATLLGTILICMVASWIYSSYYPEMAEDGSHEVKDDGMLDGSDDIASPAAAPVNALAG